MANNYTQFSEMIEDLTEEEIKWFKWILNFDPEKSDTDEVIEKLPLGPYSFDFTYWPGFEHKLDDAAKSIWLYSTEGYCEENLCNIIQAFIRQFRPDYIFSLSCACTCSKLRINELGGVWTVISKEGIEGGTTWGSADAAVVEIRAQRLKGLLTKGVPDGKRCE